jgi:N-acylneuraminate cytidylyltransferase
MPHEEFAENGGAYLINVAGFLTHRHRFFGRIGHVSMPKDRSLEIDTEADLRLAGVLHTYHQAE